ncbi:hypothetical protein V9T40_003670 [Parthenolecanium corni]|uniref:Uncharacterized protein n=1 Tax=Parthenolecanium corni TaxID=536013 RepID=A0AAN9TT73_9HEMI
MASLKKYWFGVNRENKPDCAKGSDSIESTITSVTQSTNVLHSPEKSADCEQLLKRQCSARSASTEATIATETPTEQICPTDSNTMNASAASSPSLISESTSQTLRANALQKSTTKRKSVPGGKKAAADKKGGAADKKGAAEKKGAAAKGEKKGAAAEKKAAAGEKKAAAAEKKPTTPGTTTKTPEAEEMKKEPAADVKEPVVGEESSPKSTETKPTAPAAKEAASTAPAGKAKKAKAGEPSEEPVVGEETSPAGKGARKKGKGAKAAAGAKEPKVGEEGSPGRKKGKGAKATDGAKEPKAGEEGSPGGSKRKRKGATDAEEPVVGEEGGKPKGPRKHREGVEGSVGEEKASPAGSGGRAQRRRKLENLTTKTTETPTTTLSSLLTPRRIAERRKPFSRPLTFSSRSSTWDSLSEYERRESVHHEEELQRAWRLGDSRLLKMLPTPMRRPLFLREPPDMSFENTLTSELRQEFSKRKREAMTKSSLELVRNPLMLRFIQPKMNKCEVLRKKHIKKETIMSAYFEQHYDRFQKPPFKTIHLTGRKCV